MITAPDMATARAVPQLGEAVDHVARATRIRMAAAVTGIRRVRRRR